MINKFGFLIILIFNLSTSSAKDVDEVSLFIRCYMHLTQSYPTKAQIQEIKSGTKKSAIRECLNILDSVTFSRVEGNSILSDKDNTQAKNVLRTFHNLHYSWFSSTNFTEVQDYYLRSMQNIYDTSSPALYFTRALFDPLLNYQNIFQGDETLRPIRHLGDRTEAVFILKNDKGHSPTEDILQGIQFADKGDLIGVEVMPKDEKHEASVLESQTSTTKIQKTDININTHWGGGILGSQVYMLQNIKGASIASVSDGGILAHRKWSRSVFSDFFGRKLPVVREKDGAPFVDTKSDLTYRNSTGCVKCHASADRLGGLVRNGQYSRVGAFYDTGSYAFLTKIKTDKDREQVFPIASDPDFSKRPTDGTFYYRTYNGELIDKNISTVNDFGLELLKLDDPYICTAQRYFEYFTGISADISDIGDPAHPEFPTLSSSQQTYRDIVIGLGKSLKNHKSLKSLIKEIMNHPLYKSHNFKTSEK